MPAEYVPTDAQRSLVLARLEARSLSHHPQARARYFHWTFILELLMHGNDCEGQKAWRAGIRLARRLAHAASAQNKPSLMAERCRELLFHLCPTHSRSARKFAQLERRPRGHCSLFHYFMHPPQARQNGVLSQRRSYWPRPIPRPRLASARLFLIRPPSRYRMAASIESLARRFPRGNIGRILSATGLRLAKRDTAQTKFDCWLCLFGLPRGRCKAGRVECCRCR
jgi:hypothetical protein